MTPARAEARGLSLLAGFPLSLSEFSILGGLTLFLWCAQRAEQGARNQCPDNLSWHCLPQGYSVLFVALISSDPESPDLSHHSII